MADAFARALARKIGIDPDLHQITAMGIGLSPGDLATVSLTLVMSRTTAKELLNLDPDYAPRIP